MRWCGSRSASRRALRSGVRAPCLPRCAALKPCAVVPPASSTLSADDAVAAAARRAQRTNVHEVHSGALSAAFAVARDGPAWADALAQVARVELFGAQPAVSFARVANFLQRLVLRSTRQSLVSAATARSDATNTAPPNRPTRNAACTRTSGRWRAASFSPTATKCSATVFRRFGAFLARS